MSMTSSVDSFTQYSYVTWTATLNNSGPATATNVNVSIPIPTGLAFSSKTASQGTYDLFYQVWSVGNLPSGTSATLQMTLFTLTTTPLTVYSQVQSTSTGDSDSQPNNGTPPVAVEDDEAAKTVYPSSGTSSGGGGGTTTNDSIDLEVTTTISTPNVNVGGIASFVINCKNKGPGSASGVKVKDLLPAGLTYSSHTSVIGTYTPATGEWNLGSIPAGSDRTLILNATVTQGGILKDVAQVIAAVEPDIDSQPNNDNGTESQDDEDFVNVNGLQVDLSLDVSLPVNQSSSINLNDNVTFNITLHNDGPSTSTNTKVKAFLPVGMQYVSSSASIGEWDPVTQVWVLSGTPDQNGNRPGFDILAGQNHTLTLTLKGIQTGNITFSSEVRVSNQPDLDSTPNNGVAGEDDIDSQIISVGSTSTSADLSLTMSASPLVVSNGSNLTYTITIQNGGPNNAASVSVKDVIPAGISLASASATLGTFSNGTWTIGTINSGANAVLTLNCSVTSITGPIINFAQVQTSSLSDPDSTPGNDTNNTANEDDEISVTVTPAAANNVDLSLSMTSNTTTLITGGSVVYTITVQNTSTTNATGVTVKDVLPAAIASFTSSATVGTYSASIWTIGNLNAGASATLTLTCTAGTVSANVINFAQVQTCTQTDGDSTPGNDTNNTANEDDEALVTITAAINSDLSLSMTANPTSVANGGSVTLTITLTNAGPLTATGVTVKSVLPTGFTLTNSSTPAGTFSGSTWTLQSIPSGTSATLTLTCSVGTLSAPVAVFAQVQTSTQPDPDSTPGNDTNNTANEDDEALVTINPQGFNNVDLSLTFTANNTILPLYQNIVFTVSVQNTGAVAASNVAVKYVLPSSGLAFTSSSTASGSYEAWTGLWTVGNLAAGSSATLTVTLFVVSTTPVTQFAQVWTASPTDIDSTPGNDTNNTANEDDEAILTLPYTGPQPKFIDLSLSQTATPLQASAGTNISYTINLQNTGDTIASGVSVKDILPAGISYVGSTASTGSYNNATGIWTIGNVTAGGSHSLVINATVNAISTTIVNFAQVQTATGSGDDSTPGNDTNNTPNEDDEAASSISPVGTSTGPDLSLSMTSSPTQFSIYNNLAFTLTISNTGSQAASNIKVNFAIPASTAFVSKTQTVGNYDAWTKDWTIPSLAAGATASMTLTVFTLSNAAPVVAFAQVTQQSPLDSDSAPNNAVSPVATEDDEVVLNVPPAGSGGQALSIELDQQVPFVVQNLYPNPTEDWLDISVTSIVEEKVNLEFYNTMGALIKTEEVELHYGYNHIEENLYDWKAGTYYVLLKGYFLRGKPIRFIKL